MDFETFWKTKPSMSMSEAVTAYADYRRENMTEKQKLMIEEWFWDVLPKDEEHADRRQTGCGTKTMLGLLRVMESIVKAGEDAPLWEQTSGRFASDKGLRKTRL